MIKTTKLVYYLLKNHTLTPLEIYSIDTYIFSKKIGILIRLWGFPTKNQFLKKKNGLKFKKSKL